jgi:type I restriction enzyme S subunit
MTNITQDDIRTAPLPLPTLAEQRRIAEILDRADAVRRKRKEAIALTEDLLRSAFMEMFGDPVTNPKGWPVKPLGELADIASGVTKGKKYDGVKTVSVPYMRVANVQDGHLMLDDVSNITVSEDEARRHLLQSGDLLLTEGGDPDKLGRGAVWRGEVPGSIHQNHIFRVRANDSVLPDYLSALVGSQRGKRYFLRAAKQTTGIATINMTQLKGFPALLPPLPVQERYVAFLARARGARQRQRLADEELDALFGSLAQRAFHGELVSA